MPCARGRPGVREKKGCPFNADSQIQVYSYWQVSTEERSYSEITQMHAIAMNMHPP